MAAPAVAVARPWTSGRAPRAPGAISSPTRRVRPLVGEAGDRQPRLAVLVVELFPRQGERMGCGRRGDAVSGDRAAASASAWIATGDEVARRASTAASSGTPLVAAPGVRHRARARRPAPPACRSIFFGRGATRSTWVRRVDGEAHVAVRPPEHAQAIDRRRADLTERQQGAIRRPASPLCGVAETSTTHGTCARQPAHRGVADPCRAWRGAPRRRSAGRAARARPRRRTSARLTRSRDDTITGVPLHGLTPTPRRALELQDGRQIEDRAPAGRNASLSSVAQSARTAAGARISARLTSPRARSSASTSPAWTVLPRPTASASSSRVAPPSTASAGASCHGSRSIRADRAVHRWCSGHDSDSAWIARPDHDLASPPCRPPGHGRLHAIEGPQQRRCALRVGDLRGVEGHDLGAAEAAGSADVPALSARPHEGPRHQRRSHFLHRGMPAECARAATIADVGLPAGRSPQRRCPEEKRAAPAVPKRRSKVGSGGRGQRLDGLVAGPRSGRVGGCGSVGAWPAAGFVNRVKTAARPACCGS